MSSAEKRRSPRQNVRWMGQIHEVQGSMIAQCLMTDVSASGAKLVVMEEGINVPDLFVLTLARNAGVLRHCEVAWRRAKCIGVRFLAPPR
jgi:hypothetical protein